MYEVTGLPCVASRTSFEIEPARKPETATTGGVIGGGGGALGGGARSPFVSHRVSSGYRFNDIGDHVDYIGERRQKKGKGTEGGTGQAWLVSCPIRRRLIEHVCERMQPEGLLESSCRDPNIISHPFSLFSPPHPLLKRPLVEALKPQSEPTRVTRFTSCLCYYDGKIEIFDYGYCDCDIYFANSIRTYVPMSHAITEMCKTLQLTFGLEYQKWLRKKVSEATRGWHGDASLKLRDRVLKEAKVLPNDIIDVSTFMDSKVDVNLMDMCAKELVRSNC